MPVFFIKNEKKFPGKNESKKAGKKFTFVIKKTCKNAICLA